MADIVGGATFMRLQARLRRHFVLNRVGRCLKDKFDPLMLRHAQVTCVAGLDLLQSVPVRTPTRGVIDGRMRWVSAVEVSISILLRTAELSQLRRANRNPALFPF